jgi:folate-binding protein YgfZ
VFILDAMALTTSAWSPSADDYRLVKSAVGRFDRSERGKLALTGPDSAEFLDSLLSNDIAALEPGSGCEATLLTPKGRLLAEVRVLRTGDEHWLDTDRTSLQALFDALRQYRIGYSSELHKRTLEEALVSLIGPAADSVLDEPPGPALHDNRPTRIASADVLAARTDIGIDIVCAAHAAESLSGALEAAGAVPVGEDAVECLRVESGRPRFGVDIDETTMPQEAGIHERTVSYSKGCYVGQETVARLYWKGKPNRQLRGLRLSELAASGTGLRDGEKDVGALGSVALSPRLGPIALALVRREVEPGATLQLGDGPTTAYVVELPFSKTT